MASWTQFGFKVLSGQAERQAEQQRLADQFLQASLASKLTRPKKRGPGRPRKVRHSLLTPSPLKIQKSPRPPSGRLVTRIKWMDDPLKLAPILTAVKKYKGYREAVRKLKSRMPEIYADLNESTVRRWFRRGSYTQLRPIYYHAMLGGSCFARLGVAGRKRVLDAEPDVVKAICSRLKQLRESNAAVSLNTVTVVMRAVIIRMKPELLTSPGLKLGRHASQRFAWHYLDWVPRKATSCPQKVPVNAQQLIRDMLARIAAKSYMYNIPKELIFHSDETFFPLTSVKKTTLEKEGTRHINVAGIDDKRGCTVVLGGTLAGTLIPFQVLYGGKTDACTPGGMTRGKNAKSPNLPARMQADADGHHVFYTESHWTTVVSYQQWIEKIVIPAYKRTAA